RIRPLTAPGGPPGEDALVLEWDPALAELTLAQRRVTDEYQRTASGAQLTRVRLLVSRGHVGAGETVTPVRRRRYGRARAAGSTGCCPTPRRAGARRRVRARAPGG